MKLSDAVSNAGLSIYAEIGLVAALVAFASVVVWAVTRPRREVEAMSRIPLDDSPPAADTKKTADGGWDSDPAHCKDSCDRDKRAAVPSRAASAGGCACSCGCGASCECGCVHTGVCKCGPAIAERKAH